MKKKKIIIECEPELEPFYCLKHKRWEWRLLKDWKVIYRDKTYIVPKGFETDGATIPRFFWPIFGTPTKVPRLFVAVFHDYLYTVGPRQQKNPWGRLRKTADHAYRDFAIQLGEPKFRTYIEYYMVRLFGFAHWKVTDDATA